MLDLYVSTMGNDRWSGRLLEPDAKGKDGPLATVGKARDIVRALKIAGEISGGVNVWIRGGSYYISEPIIFRSEDSFPTTYASYPGEKAIIDGGRKIDGWRQEEEGTRKVWVADLPEVAQGKWYFRQLFVNGERRTRARLPKKGYYWMESVPGSSLEDEIFNGSDVFKCAPGDIKNWRNLTDIDVVAVHYWVEERMPVKSFNEDDYTVKSTRKSVFVLKDDIGGRYARYYVENIFEALSEPGEWYLDRVEGKLYYIPMPDETIEETQIFAPRAMQFLKLEGKPQERKFIDFIKFKDIEFRHSDWIQPDNRAANFVKKSDEIDFATVPQAAYNIPGVIYFEGARNCSLEDCIIKNIGWYGIELSGGCVSNSIVGNEIIDAGGGGIKLIGTNSKGMLGSGSVSWMMDVEKVDEERSNPLLRRNANNKVMDNHIYKCGRVFHSASGIFIADSHRNEISHNHIHDLFYTGISCGFIWAYGDNMCYGNRIEKNHIHDLGHGVLSDMGGVYLLGVQPGTVVSGNVIHDVERSNYGGWGIYTDEGSSHIVIENNICFNFSSQAFHQHYGRENIVRNNIFAFGREGAVAFSRMEDHMGFTFERNVVIVDSQPLFANTALEKCKFISDLNLLWDISKEEINSGYIKRDSSGKMILEPVFTMEDLRKLGYEVHSIVADPCCRDLEKSDFTLSEESPAYLLGFRAIDISDVGPRTRI